ncbi:unnamed protein product [Cuscuta epithymum]|uniref:Holliday junction resolvase RuvC n=1 Tax=Cuscuta epithymum TaxID=186058 RepID=A0AAV0EZ90_9ASTE|nr:unnamed protein product [Cuscuta epithymum]CAH9128590.1 unnamed protein product [Cuscuta epithymum]
MESFYLTKLAAVKPTFIPPTCFFTLIPPPLRFAASSALAFRVYSASAGGIIVASPTLDLPSVTVDPKDFGTGGGRARARGGKKLLRDELRENWLDALSCPFPHGKPSIDWVIGVDPDVSGALAILKPDHSPQVFDSPHLKVTVGKGVRRRLDARSIVHLLQSFEVPIGTTAYIEQSTPFPQDGKQDDSRDMASRLFPCMSSQLKRKKDHGRAEALLIAAYGKGLKISNIQSVTENFIS